MLEAVMRKSYFLSERENIILLVPSVESYDSYSSPSGLISSPTWFLYRFYGSEAYHDEETEATTKRSSSHPRQEEETCP